MYYSKGYESPLGPLTLVCDQYKKYIVGLWMKDQKYFAQGLDKEEFVHISEASQEVNYQIDGEIDKIDKGQNEPLKVEVLNQATMWLDRYFAGQKPAISDLPLRPQGTDFRQEVWKILMDIPYGQLTTYGNIARQLADKMGKKSMSAQAVGGAVGHNPIGIIIPCHRVVGSDGSLIGYAGGIDKKKWLLEHEGINID